MQLTKREAIDEYCQAGVWGTATLDDLFSKTAQAKPDALALVDAPNRLQFTENAPYRLTYAALNSAIERLARLFIQLGLRRDDVIAVQLPNVAEQIVVMLAAFRAGLIVSPLPVMWRDYELKTALSQIAPRALITMKAHGFDHADMMRHAAIDLMSVRFVMAFGTNVPDGVMSLDDIFADDDDHGKYLPPSGTPLEESFDANDIATITWSGCHGAVPAPVPRSHNQWIAAGLMAVLEAKLTDKETILNAFPMTGLVAIGVFFIPFLLAGSTLVLHQPFDMALLLKQFEAEKIKFTGLPPAIIEALESEPDFVKQQREEARLQTLACLWPAPVLPKNIQIKAPDFGANIIDIRNLNEMVFIARQRKTGEKPALIPHGPWRAGDNTRVDEPQGPVLLDARIKGAPKINSETETLLGGDLLIKSPMMFDGFFPQAQAGAAKPQLVIDQAGYVNTGHRCELTGDTKAMIEPIARDAGTIIHGGVWISALELDRLYADYDKLSDAAAFTFDDPVMGERIVAAVVPSPGVDITLSDFKAYLETRKVAAYKLPDRLVSVKSIPRGENGEVLRDQVLDEI